MSGDFTDGPLRQLVLERHMDRIKVSGGTTILMPEHPFSKYDSPMKLSAPSLEVLVVAPTLETVVTPPELVTSKEIEAYKQGFALGFVSGVYAYVRGLVGKAFKR